MKEKKIKYFSFWINLQNKSKTELQDIFTQFEKYAIDEVLAIGSYSKTVLVASIAQEKNIFFQTWKMMLINNDEQILREHKDWFAISRNGESSAEFPPYVNYYRWLCPNHPQVLPYLKTIVAQFCQIPELKAFHLDYIRFADVILPPKCQRQYNLSQSTEEAQYDFCYCPNCTTSFQNIYGYDIRSIKDPALDDNWRIFRWQSISSLVNELTDLVHSYDKKISAAVFPTPDIARNLVRQDWTSWNIDAFYPMMYNVFYDQDIIWLAQAVKECRQKTDKPIHAGIFLPSLSPTQLYKAIELLLKLDINGISFFSFHAADSEKLRVIKSFK
ncbi:MAG: hypothetical protein RAO94_12320 [Candidatus Stygibacter australis]|nr:hypothetical protein [Candidatus Stygibacter australis]MDP8323125.1 hypothetical protein [Candidatus Stygibacter australis]